MIRISQLEFCKKALEATSLVRGASSASVHVSVNASNGYANASASGFSQGLRQGSGSDTAVAVTVRNPFFSISYAVGAGAAYGVGYGGARLASDSDVSYFISY